MSRKSKLKKEEHQHQREYLIDFFYRRLSEIALTTFTWDNLPCEIDVRYMENSLYNGGVCVFFYDEDLLEYVVLPCTCLGNLDVYGNPIKVTAYGHNGYTRDINIRTGEGVLIYNNYLRNGCVEDIRSYALRLTDILTTIQTNIKAHKTPFIIKTSKNKYLTMKNLYAQYEDGIPVIFGDDALDIEGLKVFNTDAPVIFLELYEMFNNTWNECMNFLGVPNVSTNKKERLITDEVERMQGGTIAGSNTRLFTRRDSVKKINKIFGLDIKVYNSIEGGEGSGKIHNIGENNM